MTGRRPGGLQSALGLLTVVGGGREASGEAVGWFPVVGAVLGGVLGLAWWGLGEVLPALVAGAVVVAADLALTGMLHADGLVDSADGLLPHLDRERRLSVMSEPGSGAFGVVAAGCVLLLRFAALASSPPASALKGVLLLGGILMASRSAMGIVITRVPPARPDGMAQAFSSGAGPVSRARPLLGLAGAFLLLLIWHPAIAPVVVCAELLGAGAVVALAMRRIGGYTGDVLGAAGMVGETVALVFAVARW